MSASKLATLMSAVAATASAAALAVALSGPSGGAPNVKDERIEGVVQSYLMENPQLVRQMANKLRQQEQARRTADATQALEKHADEVFADGRPYLGADDPERVVAEFFDYNCPYCEQNLQAVEDAVARDSGLRVVMVELPILRESSELASRAALAAQKQGLYVEMHKALYEFTGKNGFSESRIRRAAESVGADVEKLMSDMESGQIDRRIESNRKLARNLRISGTPAFASKTAVSSGMTSAEKLLEMASELR